MVFSTVVHVAALLILGLLTLAPEVRRQITELIATEAETDAEEPLESTDTIDDSADDLSTSVAVEAVAAAGNSVEGMDRVEIDQQAAAPLGVQLADVGLESLAPSNLDAALGAGGGVGFEGRGAAARGELVRRRGGTLASEAAVSNGLRWLAAHQMSDGHWSFDHRDGGSCNGRCKEPGSMRQSTTGATGLALLPFLGAGHTHLEGEYQSQVGAAIDYLVANLTVNQKLNTGSLIQGAPMYDHGIATIALCEAYAMSRDEKLREPAQLALNFIVYAQDPKGGGWRYAPRGPGDTSAVGWQLMALKSGYMGYLHVPQETIRGAVYFLDSVQSHQGAAYGYVAPDTDVRPGTTAVGLLCRMYTGWDRKSPALQTGVSWLAAHGPSPSNMYFNYYATQILCHWDGPEWKSWNQTLREYLIEAQSKEGHESGSWHFEANDSEHDHGQRAGGRLYFTSLATMILEVYYRHLPLYGQESAQGGFE